MGYELDVRFPEPADDEAGPRVQELAAALEASEALDLVADGDHTTAPGAAPAGSPRARTAGGVRARVVAAPPPAGMDGLDLTIPQGQDPAALEAALEAILDTCTRMGARVFDPQLGRVVTLSDKGMVAAELARWNRYEMDLSGPDAVHLPTGSYYPEPPPSGWSASTWIWAGAAALLLAGLLVGPVCGL